MRQVYNQKNITLTVGGETIRGLHEGASLVITHDGGEVQKTQGTTGPGVNLATKQGMTIQFTLMEQSPSHAYLAQLRDTQYESNNGVTIVVRTGVDVKHILNNSFLSNPGELSTGDKMQGGQTYTATSGESETMDLDIR